MIDTQNVETLSVRKTMLPIAARVFTARQHDLCGTATQPPTFHAAVIKIDLVSWSARATFPINRWRSAR